MFDSLRKLLRKSGADSAASAPTPDLIPSPFAPDPAPAEAESSFPPPRAAVPSSAKDTIRISLGALARMLPKELQGNFSPTDLPNLYLSIPTHKVVGQIAGGAVRLRLIELRRAAPVGAFTNNTEFDERLVDLPLDEILQQLPPEALSRREQKKVEVSVGDTEYFGPREKNAPPAAVPHRKEPPLPPNPLRPSAAPSSGSKPTSLPQRQQVAPASSVPALPLPNPPTALSTGPKETSPKIPEPPGLASQNETVGVVLAELARAWPEALRQEIKQTQLLQARCDLPISELSAALKQGKVQFPWKKIRSWVASPPISASAASPHAETLLDLPLKVIAPLFLARHRSLARVQSHRQVTGAAEIPDVFTRQTDAIPPVSSEETTGEVSLSETPPPRGLPPQSKGFVSLPIAAISQTWPTPVRKQISYLNLADAKLEIPLEAIEAGLRVGKVDYLWKQICAWIRPTPPPSFSAEHGEARLELPLHILAPLYLQYHPPRAESAPETDDALESTDTASRRHSSRGGLASTLELRSPVSPAAAFAQPTLPAVAHTNRDQVGDPTEELPAESAKGHGTPDDVVHETTRLPGVIGSLVSLQDGLLVASCVPAPWRAETIAAFLAQIFGRMNPYGQEFELGSLGGVSLTGDQATLHVFKSGNIFFATLAKPGANPPLAHLQSLARGLGRQTL